MLLLWIIAASGALVAVLALLKARRVGRKLDSLTHSYWELRYEYTQLRAQVAQLDPDRAPQTAPEPSPAVSFVPLSSLKK